MMGYKIYR